uniref:SH2 domain-containing protein n=1 Tax=Rhabditophanes sp. KR3021 TaxID=114890 RepID=A0AC35UI06_9BILA
MGSYTPNYMEMDSVQSPSTVSSSIAPSPATEAAQSDGQFVYLHNLSDNEYSTFKANTDLLFCGRIPIDQQPYTLATIAQHLDECVYPCYDNEKNYLLSDVLCNWAIEQQKLSVGSVWTQANNYKKLNLISAQFEYFGEILEQTLNGLLNLKTYHKFYQPFVILYEKFKDLCHHFLYYSVIVSKQPPGVIVKCGEAIASRRSRFWFNSEIRVLGGKKFLIDTMNAGSQISCHLITDETAKQLLSNAYKDITDNEDFTIEPMVAHLSSKNFFETGTSALFEDMRISKKEQLRRESVAGRRYCICYTISLACKHDIQLIGKKVSLPFAVLVGPKTEVEAKVFLERSFADLVRKPLCEIPSEVGYEMMAVALEMKFQSIIELPLKSTDHIPIIKPRSLSNQAKNHIIMRLKPNRENKILLENFLKLPVAEDFVNKKNSSDGEWKLIPFYEWFFKLADIVNKNLSTMWNNGFIYGFCSKDDAEYLLRSCTYSTLLIRFSDIEYGRIKISVKHQNGEIKHRWYDTHELASRNLQKELTTNPNFHGINCIYPNINLELALGNTEPAIPQNKKARHLQPSLAYFDNQRSAT